MTEPTFHFPIGRRGAAVIIIAVSITLLLSIKIIAWVTAQPASPESILYQSGYDGRAWQIANLMRLQQTPMGATAQAIISDKLYGLQLWEAGQNAAGGLAQPPVTDPCIGWPTPMPRDFSLLPSGIFRGFLSPFSADEVTITTQWQGMLGELWLQVFAGALVSDPTQGIVIVAVPDSPDGGIFLSPTLSGSLTIVEDLGNGLLRLTDEQDVDIYFDTLSLQFSASPQITPSPFTFAPTYTPTAGPCP
ncbi:MAG TPA: hypothetical protein VN376_02390 [Longilinea sp.]|nr:hypothetical protein [Longilinea sp.]